jgi:hypothetical protein
MNKRKKNRGKNNVTLLTTGCKHMCSGMVRSACTTSGTRRIILVTHIFRHGDDRKTFELMTSAQLIGILGSVASLLAATLYLFNEVQEK